MNQLFTIMRRWLLHDKKRTLLTLASITLSVFLISFVGVYMSTAVNAVHGYVQYEYPMHVTFYPDDLEQVGILDNNVAWESHAVEVGGYGNSDNFYTDTDESAEDADLPGKNNMFPDFTINGKSAYQNEMAIPYIIMRGGDSELFGSDSGAIGYIPDAPHKVVAGNYLAMRYDLHKGDTITLRSMKRPGKLYYGELDENGEPVRDSNGNVIYHEDTDGSKLTEIMSSVSKDSSLYAERLMYDLYSADGRDKVRDYYDYDENETIKLPPMYVELTGDGQTIYEYTAEIDDICQDIFSQTLIANINDTDILPFMGDGEHLDISYFVRVKEEADAESAAILASKSIGHYKDDDPGYELNLELLLLEGRQLEYIANISIALAFAVIIMALFVFLARLIINNAFEISAAYRTEQYGALKTIGASDKQIFGMIMIECGMYMLIAIPLGMGLAVLFGKIMLSAVRDLNVFDPILGAGVSDKLISLEFSPAIMIFALVCAFFSVFFSAYADAMRVKRMPPIRSAGYSTSGKKIKKKHDLWITRRLFGYPFGFAVKCVSRQKVRFLVTTLAAVISGILIMSISCIAKYYTNSEEQSSAFEPLQYDIEIDCYMDMDEIGTVQEAVGEIKDYYEGFRKTGYFDEIMVNSNCDLHNSGSPSFDKLLGEDFKNICGQYIIDGAPAVSIYLIPRENYEKYIKTDISYDQLAAEGKVLVCNTAMTVSYSTNDPSGYNVIKKYKDRDDTEYNVLDVPVFGTDSISELTVTGNYETPNSFEGTSLTKTIGVSGIYTTENVSYMSTPNAVKAVMPIDSAGLDILDMTGDNIETRGTMNLVPFFRLDANEDKVAEASEYARTVEAFNSELFVSDYIPQDTVERSGMKALRIVGFSFAGALGAVVLLNIFSTMSANMINRRRDLSMMRSCGMSMKQVSLSLVIESCFYAGITSIVSTAAGAALAGGVLQLISMTKDLDMIMIIQMFGFPVWGMILLFAVVMAVMAAAYIPALTIMSRSSIADEIKTKE